MTRRIEIPNSATVTQARGFMTKTDWSLEPGETLVRFHPHWCHMQPWVVAALAAWGLRAQEQGIDIRVENANRAAYAWRFGLGDYLGVNPGIEIKPHEEAGRFVALRTITNPEEHSAIMADVVTLLHLADEPEQARAVQYALSEMIRNVREHSGSPDGAVVCAQWYRGEKGDKYVSIGVADTGRGILASLKPNYPELADDSEALLSAIQPGVTGSQPDLYGSSNNAGAGLFYTRRLAESSDQYFGLVSGGAIFRSSLAQKLPPEEEMVFPISPYPGTIVCVNLSLHPEVSFDDFLQVAGRAFNRLNEELRERVASRVVFK